MQNLAQYIVRPARRVYNPDTDLGPSMFTVDKKYYCSRIDFEVKNRRYKKLKCSLFHHNTEEDTRQPLIVFCHGNSGNRTYSYEIVSRMLQAQFAVLTFDFAGCGLSEGKFIFQGFFEQFDIEDVVEHVIENYRFIDPKKIGLWGRSMGAIAALLFASHNHQAAFIIVDSPFKDFSDILNEYMTRLKIIPNAVARYISNNLRTRILKLSGFDFEELKPIEAVATCKTPALFHHASKDRIVPNYHSKDLFKAYPAEKEYLETDGGHNSSRPSEYYDSVLRFMHKIFSRRNSLRLRILHQSTSQPSKNFGEQDNDQSVGWESDDEEGQCESKKSSKQSGEPEEVAGESESQSQSQSRLELPVILYNENDSQNEFSDKGKSFSFAEDENNRFEKMILNDEEAEGLASSAPVSHMGRLESEEMTKDLSKIMSESDLISNSKPTKNIRIKPTQSSFLQEYCQ